MSRIHTAPAHAGIALVPILPGTLRASVAAWRSRGVEVEIAVVGRRARSYGVYVSQSSCA